MITLSPIAQGIFDNTMRAMQDAEEIWGPEDYRELMTAIRNDAAQRITNYTTSRVTDALAELGEDADSGWLTGGAWNAFGGCDDLRDRVGCDVTELRAALRDYFLMTMLETDLLGEVYAHIVRDRITDDQLQQIKRGESFPDDFMDGNMAMERAWYMIGSEKIDNQCDGGEGMTQSQADVWNAAYIHGMTQLEKF